MNHRHLALAMATAFVAAACADTGERWVTGRPNLTPIDEFPPPIDEAFPPPPRGPQPDFGANVTQADAPPPISGGTLVLTKDGRQAIAADPDRDQVYVVTLADKKVLTVPLQAHDEPGRVVEDTAGRAHVVLRGAGGIATIDIATGTVLSRRAVCAAPRGIALDANVPSAPRLIIACEGGDVIALGTEPDALPAAFAHLDRDLRDVVVQEGTRIFVSRFRAAEIIELSGVGAIVARNHLRGVSTPTAGVGNAILAWRMIAAPPGSAPPGTNGDPIVVHQSATSQIVAPAPGGYGGGGGGGQGPDDCGTSGSIITSLVTHGTTQRALPKHAVLPVDVASDGFSFVVVAAGNGHTKVLPQVFVTVDGATPDANCIPSTHLDVKGQATSVAIQADSAGTNYIVQSREPAQLEILPAGVIIPLSTTSREDTGHAIFHANSGAGLACASCHGEAADDGHVWTFQGTGERRTPSLKGTLKGTAPFHWNGEMKDISMLVDDVMTGRMNGPNLDGQKKDALQSWLFALPGPIAPAAEKVAVDRGRSLFESAAVGCSGCHSGARYTSSVTVDVGTGGSFQVPSLVGVGARAPYLHNGCATTLRDRFGACGGGNKHGSTSQLTPSQIDDLVTFLNTL